VAYDFTYGTGSTILPDKSLKGKLTLCGMLADNRKVQKATGDALGSASLPFPQDIRFSQGAVSALQFATEEFMVNLFSNATQVVSGSNALR
jgi:hypothetical protein